MERPKSVGEHKRHDQHARPEDKHTVSHIRCFKRNQVEMFFHGPSSFAGFEKYVMRFAHKRESDATKVHTLG
jgi:hypothetical protein